MSISPFGPWPGVAGGGAGAQDWFAERFARARTLLPGANFDTMILIEFAETVTSALVDVIGIADANPAADVSGGGVRFQVSEDDSPAIPSQGRLELTGSGSHVALLTGQWYMAALVKYEGPLNGALVAETFADTVALWADDDNRVSIGVFGNGSGGSTTNWVGRVRNGAADFTTVGPALDAEGSPFWHLFEVWTDGAAGAVHFAIDEAEFAGTVSGVNLPALAARWGPMANRSAIGPPAVALYEKTIIVVKSPTVGAP